MVEAKLGSSDVGIEESTHSEQCWSGQSMAVRVMCLQESNPDYPLLWRKLLHRSGLPTASRIHWFPSLEVRPRKPSCHGSYASAAPWIYFSRAWASEHFALLSSSVAGTYLDVEQEEVWTSDRAESGRAKTGAARAGSRCSRRINHPRPSAADQPRNGPSACF